MSEEQIEQQESAEEAEVTANEPKALSTEEQLQADLAAQNERFLRLAAEYDNFRRRNAKERETLRTLVTGETIAELLPALDNLTRALDSGASGDELRKGLELTMAQLAASFEQLGVTAFGEPGDPFDPNLHNAVQHVDSADFGENTVSAVFQQGYRLGDAIIRHAAVIAAN
ncbi:MAG: nucleotide exchange factor GrpE [Oscillospiraceae bacterium]|nr:nucleotide exchange factor GrpE [Oscillospiraceae bacterium]